MGELTLSAVTKSYGSTEVIKGVDLHVAEGEFCVFVGPSGCGKSTLLRMIAGLEEVTSGEVSLDGRDITDLPPAQREIAMVFQSYALYPHLTVAGNMGLALEQARTPKAEIAAATARAAKMLALEPLLGRRPAELSGGQRQRVAIGRAIVRRPKLFLFDEPLSNLDAALRVQTRIEIARLHRELGATMVYVTHDQVEAMTLADKIVVLNAGRVAQIGAPMELYNDPDNLFVAGFIGSPAMNFLDGAALGLSLPHVGIRPEQLALIETGAAGPATGGAAGQTLEQATIGGPAPKSPEIQPVPLPQTRSPSPQRIEIDGRISHVERLGGETLIYVQTEPHGLLTLRLFGEHRREVGVPVRLSFDLARAFLFDAQGQRQR